MIPVSLYIQDELQYVYMKMPAIPREGEVVYHNHKPYEVEWVRWVTNSRELPYGKFNSVPGQFDQVEIFLVTVAT